MADGYSLDDKRQEVSENDIPDIIDRFKNLEGETERERTERSFMVDFDEIKANGYDLSINKYKEIVYEPVQYEPTDVILGNIQICRSDKRLQCYKKEWVLDGATVQKGIHETTE